MYFICWDYDVYFSTPKTYNKVMQCSRCKQDKDVESFRKTKVYPGRGYRHVWCIPCEKEYHRTYSQKWERDNKIKRMQRQKTDEYKAKRKEWRDKTNHYENNKEYWQEWYKNNRTSIRAKMDEWRANNLDTWNGYGRKRRALMRGGISEKYLASDIYTRDGGVCGLCGELIDVSIKYPNKYCLTIDHILPIVAGGNDTADNVQVAHMVCNARKAAHGYKRT